CALEHVRSRRVLFAGNRERRGRALGGDARLDQRVDELRRREEVGLIRRQDEAARIAQLRIVQDAVVDRDRRAAAAAAAAAAAERAARTDIVARFASALR